MTRICIEDTLDKAGREVEVAGWISNIRAHGKLIFIDLRDATGILQVVLGPEIANKQGNVKPEWVVNIRGQIKKRPENMTNKELATGQIELAASEIKVLSQAKTPPFPLDMDGYEIDEEKRLKYRYLDLRRPRLQKNLRIRHKAAQFARKFLSERKFIEIETPYITKGTPEGAREFVIPSRLKPGFFYTLPQSPQQFKQLLMVAGFERYFQIARVFRDEDPRADRAYGESTQIDIETSFVSQEDILSLIEEMMVNMAKEIFPEKKISRMPFPRISYQEAMEKYKTDKPDIRQNKNDPGELAFCFIVDWPMFEWNEKEKRWDPHHHIFTSPKTQDISFLDKDPGKVKSLQHDLVLNGFEVGGGSIRITDPKVQEKVFELTGIPKEEGRSKFHHMLDAFEYGVPPHGGIAIGLDRLLMVLIQEPSLREVMAFPKTGDGRDLMMQAPGEVKPEQLEELGLKIVKSKGKNRQ